MARPKGSKNKIDSDEEEVVETSPVEAPPGQTRKEEFDPGLPESKQRHLR